MSDLSYRSPISIADHILSLCLRRYIPDAGFAIDEIPVPMFGATAAASGRSGAEALHALVRRFKLK
jgi:hypothetical protein